jgi:hypothetical protein
VYRALGNTELFGDHANRISRFYNIPADLYGSLLDVIVHATRLPVSTLSVTIYGWVRTHILRFQA